MAINNWQNEKKIVNSLRRTHIKTDIPKRSVPKKPINSANKRTNGMEKKINYLNLFEETTYAGWVMLGHWCRHYCRMQWWPSSLAFSIQSSLSDRPAGHSDNHRPSKKIKIKYKWIMKSGSSLKSFLINYNYILTRCACAPHGHHHFYGQFASSAISRAQFYDW